jgi:D-aminoacyl-tRNA deacylase
MRAVIQRVANARVTVEGETVGEIGRGLLVYLGAAHEDAPADLDYVVGKIAGLRVFPDSEGKMSLDVKDIGGSVLVISQFTLFGDLRRGRRPSFTEAAAPEIAERLYLEVIERLRASGLVVASGRFRAHMQVISDVDGPVTIQVCSRRTY